MFVLCLDLYGGPTKLLTFTERAFNIFKSHVGSKSGNQFGYTGVDVPGDNMMVVVRHEVAHQFDRVRDGDTTLRARYDNIRNSATIVPPGIFSLNLLVTNFAKILD